MTTSYPARAFGALSFHDHAPAPAIRCEFDDARVDGPLAQCGGDACRLNVCALHLSPDGLCPHCVEEHAAAARHAERASRADSDYLAAVLRLGGATIGCVRLPLISTPEA